MTSSHQLMHWMRHLPGFGGVFAYDELSHLPKRATSFIVNTQSSNLSGEHWQAILLMPKCNLLFDSMPFYTPHPFLLNFLLKTEKPTFMNENFVQSPSASTCGPHCCYFLYCHEAAPSDKAAIEFINKYLL